MFSTLLQASDLPRSIDPLRVAVIKPVGIKLLDAEEYAYQAYKFKQDETYHSQFIADVATLVKLAQPAQEQAITCSADIAIRNVRLEHSTFAGVAHLLSGYPRLVSKTSP